MDTPVAGPVTGDGCAWWNLACQGVSGAANAGLSAITKSIASGAETLLTQIVKTVEESATVPLTDPTYRDVYYGFLALAAPLIGVVLFIALIVACLRRDPGTLGRAAVGIATASLGGAFFIVLAQLLLALDNWLSRSIVRITGYNLTGSMEELAEGFHRIAGASGNVAANMLMILLMLIMLVAGLVLWFVLILRKVAILVVVAFAPLLIAGCLWGPTRSWVRKAVEVLIALVFTKTAIYALFGIGLALITRGSGQTLSDFIGATVLLCGACFTPLLMLRLVHFAADTQLAGEAMGALRGGVRPLTDRMSGPHGGMSRTDMARSQGQGSPAEAPDPALVTTLPAPQAGTTAPTGSAASGTAAGGSAAGGTAAAGGAAALVGAAAFEKAQSIGRHALEDGQALARPRTDANPPDAALRGPDVPTPPPGGTSHDDKQ